MSQMTVNRDAVCAVLVWSACVMLASAWAPVDAPLRTRWSADVHPDQSPAYPRPELVREKWGHLNGMWQIDYTVTDLSDPPFGRNLTEEILVPYPIESPLSGIRKSPARGFMFYRRSISAALFDCSGRDTRTLLHFEAVDWNTTVWVDGQLLGWHAGGYDPFSFDITEQLQAHKRHLEFVIGVYDPTDELNVPKGDRVMQPLGKQTLLAMNDTARGNHYVPTSGIWQTVWFECVPAAAAFSNVVPVPTVQLPPSAQDSHVDFELEIGGSRLQNASVRIAVTLPDGKALPPVTCHSPSCGIDGHGSSNASVRVPIPAAQLQLWSPNAPHVHKYEAVLCVAVSELQPVCDTVRGEFVVRHIALKRDAAGIPRPELNGQFVFALATLDQGFWPDGAHAAPTDAALLSDLDALKALGFNAVRKHIKVEPRRWYWHAQRIGLMVWQDFVSPDKFAGSIPDAVAQRQLDEGAAMIAARRQFGCITTWVTYNEGWGLDGRAPDQPGIGAAWARAHDAAYMRGSGRLVDACTGCDANGAGDAIDIHHYSPPPTSFAYNTSAEHLAYASLGEFGGVGLGVAGHSWIPGKCHGYAEVLDSSALTAAYETYCDTLVADVDIGLSAAVYTQTSDCERECNGVLTYDRQPKTVQGRWAAASKRVLDAAAQVSTMV